MINSWKNLKTASSPPKRKVGSLWINIWKRFDKNFLKTFKLINLLGGYWKKGIPGCTQFGGKYIFPNFFRLELWTLTKIKDFCSPPNLTIDLISLKLWFLYRVIKAELSFKSLTSSNTLSINSLILWFLKRYPSFTHSVLLIKLFQVASVFTLKGITWLTSRSSEDSMVYSISPSLRRYCHFACKLGPDISIFQFLLDWIYSNSPIFSQDCYNIFIISKTC